MANPVHPRKNAPVAPQRSLCFPQASHYAIRYRNLNPDPRNRDWNQYGNLHHRRQPHGHCPRRLQRSTRRPYRRHPLDPQYDNFFSIDSNFADAIEQNVDSISRLAKVTNDWFTISNIKEPIKIQGLRVSDGFMQIVGVEADYGRTFAKRDFQPSDTPGAMITHAAWKRGWEKDESVIDSIVTIEGKPHRIVGILPDSFTYERIDLGVVVASPYLNEEQPENAIPFLYLTGLLRPGADLQRVRMEIESITPQLHGLERWPGYWDYVQLDARHLNQQENEFLDTQINLLLMIGIIILAIAAFNVTSLMLVRLNHRSGEYAIRTALGASRLDLFRITLFEIGFIIVTGFGLGIAFGHALILVLTHGFEGAEWGLLSELSTDVSLNARVLAYTATACLAALVFIALTTTLLLAKSNWRSVFINQDTRSSTGSKPLRWITSALLFLKVATTCCLLIIGGFFLNSLHKLSEFDFGYRTDNIQVGNINLPHYRFDHPDRPSALLNMTESLLQTLRAIPEIKEAAISTLQFPHYGSISSVRLSDSPADALDQNLPQAWRGDIDYSFFDLIGLETLQGETFTRSQNVYQGEKIVVINEAFSRKHFVNTSPLNQFIQVRHQGNYEAYRIIGVVSNIHRWWLPDEPAAPGMYFLTAEGFQGYGWGWVYLKTSNWSAKLENKIHETLRLAESEIVLTPYTPLQELIDRSRNSLRFLAFIQIFVSAIGVILSTVGVYSAVSNALAQRRRETGIRIALGANPAAIRNQIIRQVLLLLAPALLLGAVSAYGLLTVSDFLANQLPLSSPADWKVYATCVASLLAIILISCVRPAIQASQSDPNKILNPE